MSTRSYSKAHQRPGKGAERLLGELELAIMQIAWSRSSVKVRDVHDLLAQQRPLAYTTVMTVMGRLADKGLLAAQKVGKIYLYRAAQTREQFEALAAGRIAHSLITDFGGEVALNQFVKELAQTAPQELTRLAEVARLAQEERSDQ